MTIRRSLFAFLLAFAIAGAAVAQEATNSSEFGRTFGGELELGVKSPSRMSGSFGLLAGTGGSHRYGATFGGTLIKDRLWFFGTAEQAQTPLFNAQVNAIGDRNILAGVASIGREFAVPRSSTPMLTAPSSFLSLHYTAMPSSNMTFSATVTRSAAPRSLLTFPSQ